MFISNCKTNHIKNPVGYAMEYASVSWIAESDRSVRQDKAQIIVAADPRMENILYVSNEGDLIESVGTKLPFQLQPCTRYYWTVQVWGNDGDTAISEVNFFETGKRELPLEGSWITTPWENQNISPYIRKEFHVSNIRKAHLYITGLGLYWLEINGKQVCDEYFAPGCTGVNHLVQVYTYDVTDLLEPGENVLGVMLGNGWAKGRFGTYPKYHFAPLIDKYLLKAELRLTLDDGTEQVITTDESWKCFPSPVIEDNIYDGEIYDARKAVANWSSVFCNTQNWENAKIAQGISLGKLEDRLSLPILVKEQIKPVQIIHTPAGEALLDMGQNMVGWIKMRVHEPDGTCIKLTHGEIMQNGCFYNENLRSAKAQYTYISDGNEHIAQPHFTFYGFRYVKVEGNTKPLNLDDFTGCVVYSDLEETGWITTSDDRINRLFLNAKWSQKGNFLDIPTDCPQRDERMGWTGDAQMFCKTACYNMDTFAFYRKYLRDLRIEQQAMDGRVGHLVPSFYHDYSEIIDDWLGGSCAWGDAAVIIPWTLYSHYGDITILEESYHSMKSWIDWIVRTNVGDSGLWDQGFRFGDWLALDGKDEFCGGTDVTLVASAYLKHSSGLVAKAAKKLKLEEDAAYYQAISDKTKRAIQNTYYTKDGKCIVQTQTAYIIALAMDLVDTKVRPLIAAELVKLLQENNMHLKTGFVGTPFLCKVLSDEGYRKEAYELLFQKDYPSWLHQVDMGATTIWERWNSVLPDGKLSGTGMNSLNHYTYGSIVRWMYENICGLTAKDEGFKTFYVAPEYTDRFSYVDMRYDSPKGTILIKWETQDDAYHLYVKVPFDTTAIVKLPGSNTQKILLTSGAHSLTAGTCAF